MTVPHKEAALAVADQASEAAAAIGAANTLVFAGGQIRADNTDAPGLIDALGAEAADLAGRPALVLRSRRGRPRGGLGAGAEPAWP